MAQTNCRFFSGYKPCGNHEICDSNCPTLSLPKTHLLVIHLEALGAVLRSTSLLPAIKRKYPGSHITWMTKSPADQLLLNNPMIDRILTADLQGWMSLKALKFDVGLVIDKSLFATGLAKSTEIGKIYGFLADAGSGAILPANSEADELWELGINNSMKFFANKKPETQLIHEALALGKFRRDPYQVELTEQEVEISLRRRRLWAPHDEIIVGINTGCAAAMPYKKLSIENHRDLIRRLAEIDGIRLVLLGGAEDHKRNLQIGGGLPVCLSPTQSGLRDGLCSVNACDIIISGDSLGLHMGIGLRKWCVAWFGPTCPQEIDLYGRGRKIITKAGCHPCWKRDCHKPVMCHDQVDLAEVMAAVREGIEWKSSLSKPHTLETCSSAFPLLSR